MTQEVVSGGLARHVVLVEGRPENVDDPFCSPTRWLIVQSASDDAITLLRPKLSRLSRMF